VRDHVAAHPIERGIHSSTTVIRGSTEQVPDELRACAVRLLRESDPKPVIKRIP